MRVLIVCFSLGVMSCNHSNGQKTTMPPSPPATPNNDPSDDDTLSLGGESGDGDENTEIPSTNTDSDALETNLLEDETKNKEGEQGKTQLEVGGGQLKPNLKDGSNINSSDSQYLAFKACVHSALDGTMENIMLKEKQEVGVSFLSVGRKCKGNTIDLLKVLRE